MSSHQSSKHGFTLVELMIVVALLAILLGASAPSISAWMQRVKTRSVGESILNGLQLTRMEAMKRNERVSFWMVSSTTSTCSLSGTSSSWMVTTSSALATDLTDKCANALISTGTASARTIQKHSAETATQGLTISAKAADGTTDANCLTYDGMGQIPAGGNIACATPISTITITSSNAEVAPLEVRITTGGQTKLCYPDANNKLASTDPRKC